MQTVRLQEVLRISGVSKSTIRNWEIKGLFPRRFKIGPKATGWDREAVEAWREARRAAAEAANAPRPGGAVDAA